MISILFVCHGNICRSPMAEFMFKDMVEKEKIANQFEIASAATSSEEIWGGVGNPVYAPAREMLYAHGIDPKGKTARQMTKADYNYYDFLIGMDRYNIKNMNRIVGGDVHNKIRMLLDYTDLHRDVADPWYTGHFEKTYADIDLGLRGFLKWLKEQEIIK